MRVTVLGASRFGVATVTQLIEAGHEVILIDHDRDRLDQLADRLDCGMIDGDGTLPSTLRDAFGDGSDALLALTNEDEVNILASVVGRSVGYGRVIPQIVRPELLSVVSELELDDTITPHESVAKSIVAALTQHSEVTTDLSLHHELRLVSHRITAEMAGKTIGDLDLPAGCRPIALIRDDSEKLAEPDMDLAEDDRLMLVVMSGKTDKLNKMFADE
jgi:trk system potassium uptake protein TrkA